MRVLEVIRAQTSDPNKSNALEGLHISEVKFMNGWLPVGQQIKEHTFLVDMSAKTGFQQFYSM